MLTKKCFPLLTFLVMLTGLILLTACRGGGDKPLAAIEVDMTDSKFSPNEFTVPAGAEVTINIKNSGKLYHSFIIKDVDQYGSLKDYWFTALEPGESKSLTFTAPSNPGDYVIQCDVPGHVKAGMVGTLHVK